MNNQTNQNSMINNGVVTQEPVGTPVYGTAPEINTGLSFDNEPDLNPEEPVVEAPKMDTSAVPMDNDQALENESLNEVQIDQLVEEMTGNNRKDPSAKNFDKMGISVPLSSPEKTVDQQTAEFTKQHENLTEAMTDLASDLNSIHASLDMFSAATDLLQGALKKIKNPSKTLVSAIGGLTDGAANAYKKLKPGEVPVLTGGSGFATFTALTGGLIKVYLWNSGVSVTMRAVPLGLIHAFQKTVRDTGYEYGKTFGAFYYLFQDLTINEFIVNKLLKVAIQGSSYVPPANSGNLVDNLLKVISWQDYHTLIWALGRLLHPTGINIRYVCGECGHVENVVSDLAKLHLLNADLITPEMADHFKQKYHTDADLQKYREYLNNKKHVTFSYTQGIFKKDWDITLKDCSIAEYLEIANEYNAELYKQVALTSTDEVTEYMQFNGLRCFKPWIDRIELTTEANGDRRTVAVVNDSTDTYSKDMLNTALDELQYNYPKFSELVQDYITSTQISRIVLYYPECPQCHAVPELSNEGYLTYDPMMTFFILALRRLYRPTVENT